MASSAPLFRLGHDQLKAFIDSLSTPSTQLASSPTQQDKHTTTLVAEVLNPPAATKRRLNIRVSALQPESKPVTLEGIEALNAETGKTLSQCSKQLKDHHPSGFVFIFTKPKVTSSSIDFSVTFYCKGSCEKKSPTYCILEMKIGKKDGSVENVNTEPFSIIRNRRKPDSNYRYPLRQGSGSEGSVYHHHVQYNPNLELINTLGLNNNTNNKNKRDQGNLNRIEPHLQESMVTLFAAAEAASDLKHQSQPLEEPSLKRRKLNDTSDLPIGTYFSRKQSASRPEMPRSTQEPFTTVTWPSKWNGGDSLLSPPDGVVHSDLMQLAIASSSVQLNQVKQ